MPSSSWIENGVSWPTGRDPFVEMKKLVSSQKRLNVAMNCSTVEQRVATRSAFVFVTVGGVVVVVVIHGAATAERPIMIV